MLIAFLRTHSNPEDPLYLDDEVEKWVIGVNLFACAKQKVEDTFRDSGI